MLVKKIGVVPSIYIPTSTKNILVVATRSQECRDGDPSNEATLDLGLKKLLSEQNYYEQQQYLDTASTAAYIALNKIDQQKRYRAKVSVSSLSDEDFNFSSGSSSSGLGYALSCFEVWSSKNLNKKTNFNYPVFATGEVLPSGKIKAIGHLKEKIHSTLSFIERSSNITNFYFCYPKANCDDISQSDIQSLQRLGGIIVCEDRLQSVLFSILKENFDGESLGRWEPFKGLKSFEYEDRLRFFGREKDIERLYNDLLFNEGFLIVSGASGCGKSSLVKAGLIPKLEKENNNFCWTSTKPSEHGNTKDLVSFLTKGLLKQDEITSSILNKEYFTENSSFNENNLVEQLSLLPICRNKLCVVYIDQFEEVFNQSNISIELLFKWFQVLTKQFENIKVVLSIRNEYLSNLLELNAITSPVISNIASQLDTESWTKIVLKQAMFSGLSFEVDQNGSSLDKIIIREALSTPLALPQVSFLLEQLHNKAIKDAPHSNLLKFKHYDELGGISGAIANRANKMLETSLVTKKLINQFFDKFVGLNSDGMPYAKFVDLRDIESNYPELTELVKKFIDVNLISMVGIESNYKVKLVHDSLFESWIMLREWLSENKVYLNWRFLIDGQFKRWIDNNRCKSYLLKDKLLLDEGSGFIKAGAVNDNLVKSYLTESLTAKRKALILNYLIFIALPILLISIYVWDVNRIKVYYYSNLGEKWGVPFGINELEIEQVQKRSSNYKFEYRGGKLMRLSHINGHGTLVSDPTRDGNALWEYSYLESGQLHSQLIKTETNKINQKITYEFSGLNAIAKKSESFGVKSFRETDNFSITPLLIDDFNKSLSKSKIDLSQQLLTFTSEGFLTKREYQNAYGNNVSNENGVFGEAYSHNEQGLIKTRHHLDLDGAIIESEQGVMETTYLYDGGYLFQEQMEASSGLILAKQIFRDKYGNIVSYKFLDISTNKPAEINGVATRKYVRDTSGNIIKESTYGLNGRLVSSSFGIASVEYEVDKNGRKVSASFFDEHSNPLNFDDGCYRLEIIYDDFGNQIENHCFDKSKQLINKLMGCAIIKTSFNENQQVEAVYCFDKNSSPALIENKDVHGVEVEFNDAGFETKVSFIDGNNNLMINNEGFASVILERDNLSRVVEERFFGANEKPITINGVHIARFRNDTKGNLLEKSFFGINSEQIEINGVHKYSFEYDALGRRVKETYLDKNNSPALLSKKGYHRKEIIFSDKENYIESEIYLNEKLEKLISTGEKYISEKLYEEALRNKGYFFKIYSNSGSAQVFINDEFVGKTPFVITTPLEQATLKLKQDGYNALETSISVKKGNLQEVTYNLTIKHSFTIDELNQKVEVGDVEAMNLLGNRYLRGEGVQKDYSKALNLFTKAASKKHPKAIFNIGLLYLNGLGVEHSNSVAIDYFEKSANLGFDEAQYLLALLYQDSKEYEKAMLWAEKSALQGFIDAQFFMFRALNGDDLKTNPRAVFWLKKAAKNGHSEAAGILAYLYEEGIGVIKDNKKSIIWMKRASDLGDLLSIQSLTTPPRLKFISHEKAFNLLKMVVSANSDKSGGADGMLGLFYEIGISGKIDYSKAIFHYEKAIKKGNYVSLFPLAHLLLQGKGTRKDTKRAVSLLKLASEYGDSRAEDWLKANGAFNIN